MKSRTIFLSLFLNLFFFPGFIHAQVESAGGVRKLSEARSVQPLKNSTLSDKSRILYETGDTPDAALEYQKWVYRKLDLQKEKNAALYYPEDVAEGGENLFRIIFRHVLQGDVPSYEYLDGKEIFTDAYKADIPEMLRRFEINASPVSGKNGELAVDAADVPASQVNAYYIIEKWEFDKLSNVMKCNVEAICPLLDAYGDYGEGLVYPMFWVKFDSLRPYLNSTFVASDDSNDLRKYSIDDYFALRLYDGEIYKTKNNRNLTLAQLFPDEDALKQAQDSIDAYLNGYGRDLWVPSREQYLEARERALNGESEDKSATVTDSGEIPERQSASTKASSSRSKKKNTKKSSPKKLKLTNSGVSNSAAEKSVRRRKK